MSGLTPDEILKGIEESEVGETMDRVLAMSDGERRRELEAAGVDLRDLRAAANALHDEIHQGRSGGPPSEPRRSGRPRRRARRPPWLWGLAGLATVLLALLFLADLRRSAAPSAVSPAASGGTRPADAGGADAVSREP